MVRAAALVRALAADSLDWLARHVILPMIERALWAGAFL